MELSKWQNFNFCVSASLRKLRFFFFLLSLMILHQKLIGSFTVIDGKAR